MNKKQQLIITMLEEAKRGFDLHRSDFEVLEQGFLNILPNELIEDLKKRNKSHIAPKIIQAKIRRIVIAILKTYFENDELARLVPVFEQYREDAEKLQLALDHWLSRRINLYSRLKPVMYDACVYGLCCAKVYWSDTLKVQRVKIKDIYIDPNAESTFDIQYVVNRVYTTLGKLKKQFGNRKIFKNYVGDYDGDNKVSTEYVGDATRILVYELYRFEGGTWRVSTLLPDYTFLRTDVPLKDGLPFVFGTVDPQFVRINETGTVEAYGASIVEPMIPLQDTYTVLRNQQIDAVNEQLNPRFLVTKTSGLNQKDVAGNKRVIVANNIDNVRELPKPNINQSLFATDKLDVEMQEVSGITKFAQGMADKHLNSTATGISILTQESNEVIADIIRSLNESFFEPLIARMVKLIYKYDTNPLLYDVDRSKNILFKVAINAGVGATNKEVMLNNITTAEQTALQVIGVAAKLGDMDKVRKYLDVLDELYTKKVATIGLKSLIPMLKEENGTRGTQGATGGAEAAGGAGEQHGVSAIPLGDVAEGAGAIPRGDESEFNGFFEGA